MHGARHRRGCRPGERTSGDCRRRRWRGSRSGSVDRDALTRWAPTAWPSSSACPPRRSTASWPATTRPAAAASIRPDRRAHPGYERGGRASWSIRREEAGAHAQRQRPPRPRSHQSPRAQQLAGRAGLHPPCTPPDELQPGSRTPRPPDELGRTAAAFWRRAAAWFGAQECRRPRPDRQPLLIPRPAVQRCPSCSGHGRC